MPSPRAGLDRVNISLDSLDSKNYCAITGGKAGDLERVLAGIDAAKEAGLVPIKLNVVVLKKNEAEIPELIDFCRRKGVILQLIELLDLQNLGISGDIEGIERSLAAQADSIRTREMHRRRKYFLKGPRWRSSGPWTTPNFAPTARACE